MKKVFACIITLFFCSFAHAGELTKQQSFHHSVTENGNIQVRLITEYLDDGKLIDKKYGDPMAPADTSNMDGWDQKSKDIVAAITDKNVLTAFQAECDHLHRSDFNYGWHITYDRVIYEDGKIAIRRIHRVYDNGEVVLKKFHRSWIMPGQDASKADVMSKAIANKIHTQPVIDAYNAHKAELAAQTP